MICKTHTIRLRLAIGLELYEITIYEYLIRFSALRIRGVYRKMGGVHVERTSLGKYSDLIWITLAVPL